MEKKPVKNKSQQPKKYVGFQPSSEDTSGSGLIFEMDDADFAYSRTSSALGQGLSNTSLAGVAPVPLSKDEHGSSFAINVPVTSNSPQLQRPASSRRLSFQSSHVGSPGAASSGISFQDRLFQQRPIVGTPVGSLSDETPAATKSPKPAGSRAEAPSNKREQKKPRPPTTEGTLSNPKSQKKTMTKAERRELQEKQRADKAARTLQAKPSLVSIGSESSLNISGSRPSLTSKASTKRQHKKIPAPNPNAGKVVSLFSHLPQFDSSFNKLQDKIGKGIIHPSVVSLALQFSEHMITGGNARCLALMIALRRVIADYAVPPGTELRRHLTQHINKQVDYLKNARSLAASMGTAVRYIKKEITELDFNLPDKDAKKRLCDAIGEFIDLRIRCAHTEIVNNLLTAKKIKNGDVILTFARSSIVSKLLIEAHTQGISFRVIIVDSRPKLEGKETLELLQRHGIHCIYVSINSLHALIKEPTKLILGASAVLSNGDIMSRIGTAGVVMAAYDARIPVMVLCEVYKFSDTVRLDSFAWNEIGNPEALVDISNLSETQKIPQFLSQFRVSQDSSAGTGDENSLKTWKDIENLKLLNLTYDITPARFVTMVCCELGQIPSTLVLSVLRTKGNP